MGKMRLHALGLGRWQMDRSLMVQNWQLARRPEPAPALERVKCAVSARFIGHPDGRWPRDFHDKFPSSGGDDRDLPQRLEWIHNLAVSTKSDVAFGYEMDQFSKLIHSTDGLRQ